MQTSEKLQKHIFPKITMFAPMRNEEHEVQKCLFFRVQVTHIWLIVRKEELNC